MGERFWVIEHTADVGIAAVGADIDEAFANAALGLFSLMVDLDTVGQATCREVEVAATEREGLLVAWLNELVYLFEVEGVLFKRFEVRTVGDTALRARCYGEHIDLSRHHIQMAVKAATYHMLKVERGDGYRVEVLFDI
ncbi:MAG: archease [Chloroflexota bacterium]|nr:archease [Chloroflexota bacterium]